MKKIVLWILVFSCLSFSAAASAFIVKKIDVEGLQRISKGTVYSYLPVQEGQDVTPTDTNTIIDALFKTGFFDNISLYQNGSTLTVKVTERPVVGNITIKGNDAIKTEQLKTALKRLGIDEGLTYNQAIVNKIKVGLEEEYYNMGYYGARINIDVAEQPRNRVALHIDIEEGVIAIIRKINFIGNKHISSDKLESQLDISTPGWFTWITSADHYSAEKLQGSMQKVVSYYMDNGYLKVKIDSVSAQVTPDKANVYITTNLTEGAIYKISGYKISGKTVIPTKDLEKAVSFKKGDVFSLKKVVAAEDSIKDMLGAKGYAFANVKFTPKMDDENHTVFINLEVDQGKLVYVRHINFVGNNKTNDDALRNNMAQVESAIINTDHIKQSKRQLSQLQYLRNIQIKTEKVPSTEDQVDVNVSMEEIPSAQVSAGVGYSEVDGIILNGTLVQKDLFGTGKSAKLQVVHSAYQETVSVDYLNPYYTTNGISRGLTGFYTSYDPSAANITSDYSYDQYGGRVYYTVPMSATVGATNKVSLGYGFMGTDVSTTDDASTQVQEFIDDNGHIFNELELTAGWSHNGLNRAVFPTQGFYQSIGTNIYLPADSNAIGYYTVKYQAKNYISLGKRFVLYSRGETGYGAGFIGTDDLPFYNNFYAGGMRTVRGYEGNTLGPRDSNGDPYGGNFLLDGSVSLIFPNFISPDNLRTSWFIDAGQVYDFEGSTDDTGLGGISKLRYGTGLDVKWISPIGLLEFSLAKAINAGDNDNKQVFDFNVGAYF